MNLMKTLNENNINFFRMQLDMAESKGQKEVEIRRFGWIVSPDEIRVMKTKIDQAKEFEKEYGKYLIKYLIKEEK